MIRLMRWLKLAMALVCLGASSACVERCGEVTVDKAERPDLILVTIDTARADRYGGAGTTPVFDALAAEGTYFSQAVTPVPITLPAHASLFTGQTPLLHGVRNNATYRLAESATTMTEVLRDAGYSTGAFVAADVLLERCSDQLFCRCSRLAFV
jgi:hypothetical protein